MDSTSSTSAPLHQQIALVTGATRGIGKGIAIALAHAGATVYITGRRIKPEDELTTIGGISGSLRDTQDLIEQAGGRCIPVPTDHGDDDQVRSLFARIQSEQNGRLDILVNNVYAGVAALRQSYNQDFWDNEVELWDACNHVGLRCHYLASIYAARMMKPQQQGFICTISSWGSLAPIFGVAYSVGKAACDRLAAEMARELNPYGITSLSLWPGIVGTEHISQIFDESQQGLINTDHLDTSSKTASEAMIRDRYNWETPLLTGRVIVALAADPHLLRRSGQVNIVAELAKTYRVVDDKGHLPASLRSLRFLIPSTIPVLQSHAQWIPDLRVPWWLLLLTALPAPKATNG